MMRFRPITKELKYPLKEARKVLGQWVCSHPFATCRMNRWKKAPGMTTAAVHSKPIDGVCPVHSEIFPPSTQTVSHTCVRSVQPFPVFHAARVPGLFRDTHKLLNKKPPPPTVPKVAVAYNVVDGTSIAVDVNEDKAEPGKFHVRGLRDAIANHYKGLNYTGDLSDIKIFHRRKGGANGKLIKDGELPADTVDFMFEIPAPKAVSVAVDLPPYDPSTYDFKDYLHFRINNREDGTLLERSVTIKAIEDSIKNARSRARASPKPTACTLFSSRGSGKTSLLRHIALESAVLKDQRKCGRILVFDFDASLHAEEFRNLKGGLHMIRSLVVHHLCEIFGGTTVDSVQFPTADFAAVYNKDASKLTDSLLKWMREMDDRRAVYKEWHRMTAAAFGAKAKGDPVLLCDTVEGIDDPKTAHSTYYTILEQLMAAVEVGHAGVYMGTAKSGHFHSLLQGSVNHHPLPPLAGLTRKSAEEVFLGGAAMNAKKQRFFNVVYALSSGVPRMVATAWETMSENPTADPTVWITNWEKTVRGRLYLHPDDLLRHFTAKEIAYVLLNCVAGSPMQELDPEQKVPGIDKRWQQFQRRALVFASANDDTGSHQWTFPRVLWDERTKDGVLEADSATQKIVEAAKKISGVNLLYLFPSVHDLYADGVSDTQKGVLWEKMFCAGLVARHRVCCWEEGKSKPILLPLSDVMNDRRKPLTDVKVSFSQGLLEGASTTTVARKHQHAIFANWKASGTAHHDFVIGVVRGRKTEMWAGCCKAESPKREGVLEQCYKKKDTRKAATDEVPVLLQVCRYDRSKIQRFACGGTLAKFEAEHRYLLVDANLFLPQLVSLFDAFGQRRQSAK